MTNILDEFKTLVEIVAKLRGPGGCPWDKEQTQKSLTHYVIEEAFELVEAIETQDQKHIQEELGDYLFQVMLQAQVAEDEHHFQLVDVLKKLNQKLVTRHPHVFGDVKVKDAKDVWQNWHQMKNQERTQVGPDAKLKKKPVFNYPKDLPALLASFKIGQKTEGFKFDWESPAEVIHKVEEELAETIEAMNSGEKQKTEEEIGDLLFSISQLARHLKINPEAALRGANRKFEKRFNLVLESFKGTEQEFIQLSTQEKELLWQKLKLKE